MGRELSIIAAIILTVFGLFFFWKSEDFVASKAHKESLRQQIKLTKQDLFLDVQYDKLVNLAALNAEYYDRDINRYIEIKYKDEETDLIAFVERVYNKHFVGVCEKKEQSTDREIKKFLDSVKNHSELQHDGPVVERNPIGIEQPYVCSMVMHKGNILLNFSAMPDHVVEYFLTPLINSQKSK